MRSRARCAVNSAPTSTIPTSASICPSNRQGTEYQQSVWEAVRAIPRGADRSATSRWRADRLRAAAGGTACGANRIPLLIPCHRVVASGGLGGFMHSRGGKPLEIKRWLLRHEGAVA